MLIKFHVQTLCWEEVMLDLGEENNLRIDVVFLYCLRGYYRVNKGDATYFRDNQGIGPIYAKSQQKT